MIRTGIIHLSRTIIKRTKPRNMILLGHVTNMVDIKYAHKSLVGITEGKNNLVHVN